MYGREEVGSYIFSNTLEQSCYAYCKQWLVFFPWCSVNPWEICPVGHMDIKERGLLIGTLYNPERRAAVYKWLLFSWFWVILVLLTVHLNGHHVITPFPSSGPCRGNAWLAVASPAKSSVCQETTPLTFWLCKRFGAVINEAPTTIKIYKEITQDRMLNLKLTQC